MIRSRVFKSLYADLKKYMGIALCFHNGKVVRRQSSKLGMIEHREGRLPWPAVAPRAVVALLLVKAIDPKRTCDASRPAWILAAPIADTLRSTLPQAE